MKAPLRRTMGSTWWLVRGAYTRIMLRELTSVFIAAYLILVLILFHKVAQGAAVYLAYREFLWSPAMVIFHLVALAFALMHTISFFDLFPKVMRVFRGEERLHPALVAAPMYVAWAIVTAVILLIVLK